MASQSPRTHLSRAVKRTSSSLVQSQSPPPSPSKKAKVAAREPPVTPKRTPSASTNTTPKSSGAKAKTPASPWSFPDVPSPEKISQAPLLVPSQLKFDFEDARRHLTVVDARFGEMMSKLTCKPFENVHDLTTNPWKSLACSILGQQVSWLAAKAITHRFTQIYFPDLPPLPPSPSKAKAKAKAKVASTDLSKSQDELPSGLDDVPPAPSATTTTTTNIALLPFPTPLQVLQTPGRITALRGAGLSQRKAEYISDLAARFVDGRITAEKLVREPDYSVLEETLVAVRGIGKWTVEMFAIFTLRHPDVLPVGDLGIQKGLLRWYTSSNLAIHPAKLPKSSDDQELEDAPKPQPPEPATAIIPADDFAAPDAVVADPGTSEIQISSGADAGLPKLPEGCSLNHAQLKARFSKKLKGGAYLSPVEMEELTAPWKPYRSVAIWYLWSIEDGDGGY